MGGTPGGRSMGTSQGMGGFAGQGMGGFSGQGMGGFSAQGMGQMVPHQAMQRQMMPQQGHMMMQHPSNQRHGSSAVVPYQPGHLGRGSSSGGGGGGSAGRGSNADNCYVKGLPPNMTEDMT